MSDIVDRLNRAGDLAIPGEPCGIYYDAANEITRLRLTDAERSAIKEASEFYVGTRTGVALRGLLERLGGER